MRCCPDCGKSGLPAEDDAGRPVCMWCGARRPEAKARKREYQREYAQRPEVKERQRERQREYYRRRRDHARSVMDGLL